MTVLEFAAANPVTFCSAIMATGMAVGQAFAAPVKLLVNWKRPGDCPRCNGTGREPKR